jgi:capsular polysaccharide transport system permease protein
MDAVHAARRGGGKPRAQHLRVILALVMREMGTRFGRSEGGYLWAIGEPLGGILLLAIFFSLALRTPPLGTSFILFYATGHIPYNMFKSIAARVSGAVNSNRALLNYPVVTVLDAVLAKFVLSLLTMLVVAVILFTGIILVFDLPINLDLSAVARSLALAAALGLGIGTLNCLLFGLFRTWRNIWKVLTRPLYLLSGVLFTFESVPARFQHVLWWNPVIHVTAEMRAGFYGTYDPQFVSYAYVLGIALGTFVIGAYLMRRHASALIEA